MLPEDGPALNPVLALSRDHARGAHVGRHSHARAQLIFLLSGAMRIGLDDRVFSVPPGQAAFLPGGVPHAADYTERSAVRVAYLDPATFPGLPGESAVLPLAGLLRELVLRAIALDPGAPWSAADARAMQVLADEICRARDLAPGLALGRDARLRRVTEALVADPADRRSLPEWAVTAAVAERTLARLFVRETGLSFARWRTRLQIARAREALAAGRPVTQIAYDLGYASPSAFTAMFTRETGQPPHLSRATLPGAEDGSPSFSLPEILRG